MKGKKAWVLPVCTLMVVAAAIGGLWTLSRSGDDSVLGRPDKTTAITFWVYPIGDFSDKATVDKFVAAFNKEYPDIQVTVGYLDYQTGDEQVSAAIAAGTTPDVIMEGPERLVAGWGAKGVMVDLKDLWTDGVKEDIAGVNSIVTDACRGSD